MINTVIYIGLTISHQMNQKNVVYVYLRLTISNSFVMNVETLHVLIVWKTYPNVHIVAKN